MNQDNSPVLFFSLSLSLSLSLLFLHDMHTLSQALIFIYLQNVLVLIYHNHINPEFSGPNLIFTLLYTHYHTHINIY